MLFSLAIIFIIGFLLSGVFQKLKLPGILGMLLTGVILGPYVLALLTDDILDISSDLRQIALIVILARAGLSLDITDLKKVGRPAILMCFVPATLELLAVTIFAPIFFDVTLIEALIMGAVLAAVSPAVIVPRMLRIMESGYGKERSVPQIVLAGASVDDVFVIVLFTSFMNMYGGNGFSIISLITVPIAIVLGLLLGFVVARILIEIFKYVQMTDTMRTIVVLSVSFLFVTVEEVLKGTVPVSGLLAVMSLGLTIFKSERVMADELSLKLSKIWIAAEVLLFALVGASVDITYMKAAGVAAVLFIVLTLLFRILGVYISLLKTNLTRKEKLFCAISYIPKATVQAAIGGIPLASGVTAGNTILTVAVLAIAVTAPIGAIGVDVSYKSLLNKTH